MSGEKALKGESLMPIQVAAVALRSFFPLKLISSVQHSSM
jgi:hypothetical protein